jgi:hypothetical protein
MLGTLILKADTATCSERLPHAIWQSFWKPDRPQSGGQFSKDHLVSTRLLVPHPEPVETSS